MTLPFYMGRGHHGAEPKIEDVLDCLCSDASGYDNARNFEDWCGEYGFDSDSRTAERIYKKTGRNRDKLANLLGDDYNAFLFETERL